MTRVISRAEPKCFNHQLDAPVGGSGVASVGIVAVELFDDDGASGLGFSYLLGGGPGIEIVAKAMHVQLQQFVLGKAVPHPRALWRQITGSFNRMGLGPNLLALAAIDLAVWDLYARRGGLPLGEAMGGELRSIPVYGSGGFNAQQSPSEAAEIARSHIERGLRAVKPRVGGLPQDLVRIVAVREAVADSAHVMLDANEKPDLPSAKWLMEAARDNGVLFVEEPLPSDFWHGYERLRGVSGPAVAWGEHAQSLSQFAVYASKGFASVLQPDLAMAGGLTPVLEICTIAEAMGATVSPHFLPGLFVHVGAASRALSWLEDFPLLESLFEGWPVLERDGTLRPLRGPGHGLRLRT
jgi:L-alanine-DL-glutamate epimerase-like enolase superfamily enzyme